MSIFGKKRGKKAVVRYADSATQVQDVYFAQRQSSPTEAYADVHFVFEIVGSIARFARTIPLKVYRQEGTDGDRHNVEVDHAAYRLLRRPNPETPRSLLIEHTVGDLCLAGNAFWLKVRNRAGAGPPLELWRLKPDRMEVVPNKDGTIAGWIHRIPGNPIGLRASDVIHFRSWSAGSDYLGQSPIESLRYEVELGRDAEQAAIDLWANGMMPSIGFKVPGTLSEEAYARLAKGLRQAILGKGKRYSPPLLEEGLDPAILALNPRDAEFINTARLARERVAAAFNYPLPESFERDAGPEDIRRARFSEAVLPWLTLIEETLETFLMPEYGDAAVFPQFVTRHVLDPSMEVRFAAYKDGIYAGWLPPEWVAKLEDVPTDLPRYLPLNVRLVGEDGIPVDSPGPTPENDTTGGMGGDEGRDQPSTGEGNAKAVPWFPEETPERPPREESDLTRTVSDLSSLAKELARRPQPVVEVHADPPVINVGGPELQAELREGLEGWKAQRGAELQEGIAPLMERWRDALEEMRTAREEMRAEAERPRRKTVVAHRDENGLLVSAEVVEEVEKAVDRSDWDGPAAMRSCSSAADFRSIAFERANDSDPDTAAHWALPHHKRPGAPPNAKGVSAALGALGGARGGAPGLKNGGAARRHLEAHRSAIENTSSATPAEGKEEE